MIGVSDLVFLCRPCPVCVWWVNHTVLECLGKANDLRHSSSHSFFRGVIFFPAQSINFRRHLHGRWTRDPRALALSWYGQTRLTRWLNYSARRQKVAVRSGRGLVFYIGIIISVRVSWMDWIVTWTVTILSAAVTRFQKIPRIKIS